MNSRRLHGALVVLLATTLFAGCKLGPNYQRPPVDVPDNFRFATSQPAATQPAETFADLPWWEVFKDPNLQELIRTALDNNYNLRQAVARVEQARNLAIVAGAPLYPQVNYGGDLGHGKNALFNTPTVNPGSSDTSILLNVNIAWEIDVWGRIRRLSEEAQAQYLATEEGRRAVIVMLVSDVATAYYQLLAFDREVEIQRAAAVDYEHTLRIFNDRRVNGVASKLETDRASAALANANAIIPDLQMRIAQTENRLNVLLGRNPTDIVRSSIAEQSPVPPEIPAGLPSDLLQRRPDIAAAEQFLVAANANIGANLANFFPRIGLTTFFGKASPELSAFTAGSSNMWNVGASLAGPIFQGGQLRAEYRASLARFDEATSTYQLTILTAFQEVSDALVSKQKFAEIRVFDQQAVTALESAVQLSFDRYINGKSGYYEVLLAQQDLYPAQRAEVDAQVGEFIAVVQLYRALGGGWSVPPEE